MPICNPILLVLRLLQPLVYEKKVKLCMTVPHQSQILRKKSILMKME